VHFVDQGPISEIPLWGSINSLPFVQPYGSLPCSQKQATNLILPVTVAEWSKACTLFVRSEAGIVGSDSTQSMAAWCFCVCSFLCVCVLIARPRSPTECLRSNKPKWNGEFHGGRPRSRFGLERQRKNKSYINSNECNPHFVTSLFKLYINTIFSMFG
jgi:hypothetical protein